MTVSTADPTRWPDTRARRRTLRLPGVYRPQEDTRLLSAAVAAAGIPPGARVLDVCTGTGAVAVTAARLGAAHVTAVDVSRRAVLTAWLNSRTAGLPVRTLRASFVDMTARGPFDVVLANPPYVPCRPGPAPTGGDRAWDAGPDGRSVLEPLCRLAPLLLAKGGFLLLVQSDVADTARSLDQLRAGGLEVGVVTRQRNPFGPVMRGRTDLLERQGQIRPGQRHETLVVIRADRT